VGDWSRQQGDFDRASIGTQVWDPPHLRGAGETGLVGDRALEGWDCEYGTRGPDLTAPTVIIDQFAPYFESVEPILIPGRGTVIVKMADQVRASILRSDA
jgi:hypothetical protein